MAFPLLRKGGHNHWKVTDCRYPFLLNQGYRDVTLLLYRDSDC